MARQDEKQALVISARILQNFRPNATKNCPNPKANPNPKTCARALAFCLAFCLPCYYFDPITCKV